MTAPRDLTTIVESVARDECERLREFYALGDNPIVIPAWEDTDGFTKSLIRERVLPIVTATVRAIDQGDEL